MYVKRLHLKQFRNYDHLELEFQPGIHLFVGDNAQGKTNLLESFHVLSLTKSHRLARDRELIQWQEEYCRLEAEIVNRYGSTSIQLSISPQGKQARVNHLEQKRLSDYIGTLNVVMFAPEDLELVKGTPQVRRRFIDMELGQVSPHYLYLLSVYQKLLIQRNTLLKAGVEDEQQRAAMGIFTQQLADVAAKLYVKRFHFLAKLEEWAQEIHHQISGGKEKLALNYQSPTRLNPGMDHEEIAAVLNRQFEKIKLREERQGSTLIGPHRDDLLLTINGHNVRTFGSQGQQRTAALSLKLAEIELIKEEKGEYPILLLDDVLSELDEQRRSDLLAAIRDKVQTFVTDTSTEGIDHRLLELAEIYTVREGKVERQTRARRT